MTTQPHHLDLHVLSKIQSLVGLWQVRELGSPGEIYRQCMGMMVRLAELGLVHCDFNEFNLLVSNCHNLGLPLGLEAPVMTPNSVIFSFSFLF